VNGTGGGVRVVAPPAGSDLGAAAAAVRANLQPTPIVRSELADRQVALKVETAQPTGSFKVRGAIAALTAARDRGATAVVAASAGNHGLGVAWAAQRLGIAATIVVPESASPAKLTALARFDVDVVTAGQSYDDAEAHAIATLDGRVFVSPYNDPHVIAGQATIGAELVAEVPHLAAIVVPVGGGGLVSGVALSVRDRDVAVIGVEAAASSPLRVAMDAGRIVPIDVRPTLADGLAGNLEPGSVTAALVRDLAVQLTTVEEDEIAAAMRYLAAEQGLVVEPSGAVGVAAALSGKLPPIEGPIAIVLTGRNVSLRTLADVLTG
jgi:threonine dehydratase